MLPPSDLRLKKWGSIEKSGGFREEQFLRMGLYRITIPEPEDTSTRRNHEK